MDARGKIYQILIPFQISSGGSVQTLSTILNTTENVPNSNSLSDLLPWRVSASGGAASRPNLESEETGRRRGIQRLLLHSRISRYHGNALRPEKTKVGRMTSILNLTGVTNAFGRRFAFVSYVQVLRDGNLP